VLSVAIASIAGFPETSMQWSDVSGRGSEICFGVVAEQDAKVSQTQLRLFSASVSYLPTRKLLVTDVPRRPSSQRSIYVSLAPSSSSSGVGAPG
jgi:hypothetical protein